MSKLDVVIGLFFERYDHGMINETARLSAKLEVEQIVREFYESGGKCTDRFGAIDRFEDVEVIVQFYGHTLSVAVVRNGEKFGELVRGSWCGKDRDTGRD